MSDRAQVSPPERRPFLLLLACLLYSLVAYLLLEWYFDATASITVTFLIVVPSALASFVSFVADPRGERSLRHHLLYALVPLLAAVIGGLLLREGVICILMLLPLWSIAALLGTTASYVFRRRERRRTGGLKASAILLVPIVAAQVEAASPVPVEHRVVRSEIEVNAAPAQVWPLLLSIRDIAPEEGRWNLTQDLLRVPRPSHALLTARGNDTIRLAFWGPDVRFEERIVVRQEEQAIAWRFAFPDKSVQDHTDRHIAPDGLHLQVETGGYRLTALPGGRTRVELHTSYRLRTPLNAYASWWGEWMLGDIQENVLHIIKNRAERR